MIRQKIEQEIGELRILAEDATSEIDRINIYARIAALKIKLRSTPHVSAERESLADAWLAFSESVRRGTENVTHLIVKSGEDGGPPRVGCKFGRDDHIEGRYLVIVDVSGRPLVVGRDTEESE